MRTITALALAALAEAATPYGIESFDSVLKPLWKGIRTHRGKGLAAFLKAIGYLIPLMDAEYANYYTKEVSAVFNVPQTSFSSHQSINPVLFLGTIQGDSGGRVPWLG